MEELKNKFINGIIDIHNTERNEIYAKKYFKNSCHIATVTGKLLENISVYAWSTVAMWFNDKYDSNFRIIRGDKSKILCKKTDDIYVYKHVDIHIFNGDELIHGEESKMRSDNVFMGSVFEIAYSIKEYSNFNPTISILSIYKKSYSISLDYFCIDNYIDNISILTGKASSTGNVWHYPLLEHVLEDYFNYIYSIYDGILA